jgi:hypothetical protein
VSDDAVSDDAVSGSEAASGEATPEERRALFRVVRGEPTDEELAALTVVIAAAASAGGPPPEKPRDLWSEPASLLRTPLPPSPGPGAWKASALPR